MAQHNLQVSVTLFSLENNANSRSFVLDPDKATIRVGRASKSVHKGIQANSTNAWFDSPIMSRQHASFIMDSCAKVISLRDLGSTHGTWIGNVRLQKELDAPLSSGVMVTFGSKVMAGPVTYQPQTFRVMFEWSHWSKPNLDIRAPPSTPRNQAITYSVPDDSECDSDSDASVASVAFVKRQSRVFLVPSSDGESEDGDSLEETDVSSPEAVKGIRDCTDTISSPPSTSDPYSPNIKAPIQPESPSCAGAILSRTEKRSGQILDSPSSDGSDDEGPDVLPIGDYEAPTRPGKEKATQAEDFSSSDETDSEDGMPPLSIEISDRIRSAHVAPETPLAGPDRALLDADIVPKASNMSSSSIFKLDASKHEADESVQAPGKQATRADSMEATPWTQDSGAPNADELCAAAEKASAAARQSCHYPWVDSVNDQSGLAQTTPKARSPSPSDAALAKKASTHARWQQESWQNNLGGWWAATHGPRSRDATLNFNEPFVARAGPNEWNPYRPYFEDFGDYYGEDPYGHAYYDNEMRVPDNTGEPSSYLDGPFISSARPRRPNGSCEPSCQEIRHSSASKIPESTTCKPMASRVGGHSDPATLIDLTEPEVSGAQSSQASKLNISNLLQSPLPGSPSGSLKRKADAISDNEPQAQIERPTPQTVTIWLEADKSKPPRTPRGIESGTSHTDQIEVNTAVSAPTAESSAAKPTVVNRPSKKVKTNAARVTGLARFTLGVGVGALGVLGAFVASIPASVRHEAWREFQDAQR